MKKYKKITEKNLLSQKKRMSFFIFAFFAIIVSFSSCSMLVLDYTLISSRTHTLNFDLTQGKIVEGIDGKFLNPGTIKGAMDKALASAGPGYDILIDGVVYRIHRPLAIFIDIDQYKVTGTAVNSRNLIATLGEEGFQEWLAENNVFDSKTAFIVEE